MEIDKHDGLTGDARARDPGFLRADEQWHALDGGMGVLQKTRGFRFGTDSVELANFARVKPGERVCDLGCGSGVIALLMANREKRASFDLVELEPDIADMAARSVAINDLTDRVTVHTMDMRDAPGALGHGAFHLVVCNPPYQPDGCAIASADARRSLARHLTDISLDEIARAGAGLLRNGGRMALVYPAARMAALLRALEDAGLAPKRAQMIHSRIDAPPKLFLVDAIKQGGAGIEWLPPRILS